MTPDDPRRDGYVRRCFFAATAALSLGADCGPTPRTPPPSPPDCVDRDRDGFGRGAACDVEDCDDDDPTRHPGASERCNGRDDNCDLRIDEAPVCAPLDAAADLGVEVVIVEPDAGLPLEDAGADVDPPTDIDGDPPPDRPLDVPREPAALTEAGAADAPFEAPEVDAPADAARPDTPVALDVECAGGCDDLNPCTADRCAAGVCTSAPVADGTVCGALMQCARGRCACPMGASAAGSFSVRRPASSTVDAAELLDIDGDGDLDYMVHTDSRDVAFAWQCFSNDGRGSFRHEPGWTPVSIARHGISFIRRIRMDGDARDDFVAVVVPPTSTSDLGLEFYRNGYRGGDRVDIFSSAARFARMPRVNDGGYCWGDIDGDGRHDFVFADVASRRLRHVTLDPARGAAVEQTDSPLREVTAVNFVGCGIGDIDDDGSPDLVVVLMEDVRLYRQVAGRFVASGVTGARCSSVDFERRELPRMIDVNADRRADLVCRNEVLFATSTGFGLRAESFSATCDEGSAILERTCTGAPHMVCASDTQLLLWNVLGALIPRYELRRENTRQLAAGDLDRDGLDDFVGLSDGSAGEYTARVYLTMPRLTSP